MNTVKQINVTGKLGIGQGSILDQMATESISEEIFEMRSIGKMLRSYFPFVTLSRTSHFILTAVENHTMDPSMAKA